MALRPKDLKGMVSGELTVIEPVERRVVSDGRTRTFWRCRCSCGREIALGANRLTVSRGPKHCGDAVHRRKRQPRKKAPPLQTMHIAAWRMQLRRKSLVGMRFGELTVLSVVDYRRHGSKHPRLDAVWLCQCSCGRQKTVGGKELKRGRTRSCGHLLRQRNSILDKPFSNYLAYSSWSNIKYRCYNKKCDRYSSYGGRGIGMCERWRLSFPAFLSDMGERPGREYSIDRIDPNGDYEPGNCRWAIDREQRINKRNTRYVPWDGRMRLLVELCREHQMPYSRVAPRVYVMGWSVERALTTPIKRYVKA